MKNSLYIAETNSTNNALREIIRKEKLPEGFVVYTDFQTAGKGQAGNSWESENGKNLLFSMVLYPQQIPLDRIFLISQLVSLGVKKSLDRLTTGITVKWPNDLYWNEKKIAGILIENSLQGNKINAVTVGIGMNVNQKEFRSDAPNPVSLFQILGIEIDRNELLVSICKEILSLYKELNAGKIRLEYEAALYRKIGYHSYVEIATGESFRAKIVVIRPDGMLELETESGNCKSFYFKEVKFV
jgi:BirA family transcriptional regulator, biotin operon repressor / biotin---[acetyl-CoA-carboxylase] ligase